MQKNTATTMKVGTKTHLVEPALFTTMKKKNRHSFIVGLRAEIPTKHHLETSTAIIEKVLLETDASQLSTAEKNFIYVIYNFILMKKDQVTKKTN